MRISLNYDIIIGCIIIIISYFIKSLIIALLQYYKWISHLHESRLEFHFKDKKDLKST